MTMVGGDGARGEVHHEPVDVLMKSFRFVHSMAPLAVDATDRK